MVGSAGVVAKTRLGRGWHVWLAWLMVAAVLVVVPTADAGGAIGSTSLVDAPLLCHAEPGMDFIEGEHPGSSGTMNFYGYVYLPRASRVEEAIGFEVVGPPGSNGYSFQMNVIAPEHPTLNTITFGNGPGGTAAEGQAGVAVMLHTEQNARVEPAYWPGGLAAVAVRITNVNTNTDHPLKFKASVRAYLDDGEPAADAPGCAMRPSFGTSYGALALAGDPVEVSTGNMVESRTDLVGGDGAYGLSLQRSYNSRDARKGVLGVGWSTAVDQKLTQPGDGSFEWRMPDGRTAFFESVSAGVWTDIDGIEGDLVESGDGHAVQFHSGERIEFDENGIVTRWCSGVPDWETVAATDSDWCSRTGSDPLGGEWVDVDRATAGTIKLINPRAGQSIWLIDSTSDGKVDAAEARAGSTVFASATYTRDGSGRLTNVLLPGGGEFTYTYDAGRMSKVEEKVDSSGTRRTLLDVAYDDEGRVEYQVEKNGDEITFDYTVPGKTVVSYDADGATGSEDAEVFSYQTAGGLLEGLVDSSRSHSISKSWDKGQLDSFSNRRTAEWDNDYDAATGRLTKRTYPNPATGVLDTGIFEEWTYVSATDSRVASYRNREGELTCYSYTGGPSGDDTGDMVPALVKTGVTSCTSSGPPATIKSSGDLVLESTDPDGVKTCIGYASGTRRVESVTEACGTAAAVTTTYAKTYSGSGGWTETVTTPKWGGGTSTVTSTYDAAGRLVSVADAIAGDESMKYYPDGRIKEATDETGAKTCHSYAQTTGGSTHTIVELNSYTGSCASPPERSRAFIETFDKAERLVSVAGPDGALTSYTYGRMGRVATATERVSTSPSVSYVTHFDYDADGNLTKTTRGGTIPNAAEAAETTYDHWGRVTSEVAPSSETGAPQLTTVTEYDLEDRVTAVREKEGGTERRVTTMEYDNSGRLWKTHNPMDIQSVSDDAIEERLYTPGGRLVTVEDFEGGVTHNVWDVSDSERTGQLDKVCLSRHYVPGTPATETEPEVLPSCEAFLDYTYDEDTGLLEFQTTPGGITSSFGYDVVGRQTTVTSPDPDGSGTVTVTTAYNARGEVSSVTQPLTATENAVTAYSYTPFGEVLRVANPRAEGDIEDDAHVVEYGYDGRGNRTSRTRWVTVASTLTPETETWEYNLADQVTRHEGLDYEATPDNAETWTYDTATGELTEAKVGSTSDGSYRVARYGYYNSGAVKQVCFDDDTTVESTCTGDTTSTRVGYEYNALGQRTKMTDPRGDTTYAYADRVNLTERVEPGGVTVKWTWDQNSRPHEITYPGTATPGVRLNWFEDGLLESAELYIWEMWVPSVEYTRLPDGQVDFEELASTGTRDWAYDNPAGLASNFSQNVDGTSTDTDLTYDRAGRLATATKNDGHVDTYTYDLASQLLSQIGSTSGAVDDWTYTYGEDGRRLTGAHNGTTVTYSHGPDGRITGDGTRTYTYDLAGRLTNNGIADLVYNPRGLLAEVNPTNPANHYEDRAYDGDGNLVEHTTGITGNYSMEWSGTAWDPTQPIPNPLKSTTHYDSATLTNTSTDTHLYGDLRIVSSNSWTTSWYAYDHLGNVVDTNNYDAPNTYSPYGDVTGSPFFPFYWGYRGERHTNGTIHLRARTYDPNIGSFTTKDPLDGVPGTPTEANPYHYTDNDPINRIDPLGLRPCDADPSFGYDRLALPVGLLGPPTVVVFGGSKKCTKGAEPFKDEFGPGALIIRRTGGGRTDSGREYVEYYVEIQVRPHLRDYITAEAGGWTSQVEVTGRGPIRVPRSGWEETRRDRERVLDRQTREGPRKPGAHVKIRAWAGMEITINGFVAFNAPVPGPFAVPWDGAIYSGITCTA